MLKCRIWRELFDPWHVVLEVINDELLLRVVVGVIATEVGDELEKGSLDEI